MSKHKAVEYKDKCWYVYNGIGDPYLASSYRRITVRPRGDTGNHISAIYSSNTGNSTTTALSTNIKQYIANALASGLSQPPVFKPHHKCFVYLKD